MNRYKKIITCFSCIIIFNCAFQGAYSQSLVNASEIVPIPEGEMGSARTSLNVVMLQKLCQRAVDAGVPKIAIYLIGNSVLLNRPAGNPHAVRFEVSRLMPILEAYQHNNISSIQFTVVQMDEGQKNLILKIPSGIAQGSSGDAPATNGLVGVDMGQICPPPTNCSSSDTLN